MDDGWEMVDGDSGANASKLEHEYLESLRRQVRGINHLEDTARHTRRMLLSSAQAVLTDPGDETSQAMLGAVLRKLKRSAEQVSEYTNELVEMIEQLSSLAVHELRPNIPLTTEFCSWSIPLERSQKSFTIHSSATTSDSLAQTIKINRFEDHLTTSCRSSGYVGLTAAGDVVIFDSLQTTSPIYDMRIAAGRYLHGPSSGGIHVSHDRHGHLHIVDARGRVWVRPYAMVSTHVATHMPLCRHVISSIGRVIALESTRHAMVSVSCTGSLCTWLTDPLNEISTVSTRWMQAASERQASRQSSGGSMSEAGEAGQQTGGGAGGGEYYGGDNDVHANNSFNALVTVVRLKGLLCFPHPAGLAVSGARGTVAVVDVEGRVWLSDSFTTNLLRVLQLLKSVLFANPKSPSASSADASSTTATAARSGAHDPKTAHSSTGIGTSTSNGSSISGGDSMGGIGRQSSHRAAMLPPSWEFRRVTSFVALLQLPFEELGFKMLPMLMHPTLSPQTASGAPFLGSMGRHEQHMTAPAARGGQSMAITRSSSSSSSIKTKIFSFFRGSGSSSSASGRSNSRSSPGQASNQGSSPPTPPGVPLRVVQVRVLDDGSVVGVLGLNAPTHMRAVGRGGNPGSKGDATHLGPGGGSGSCIMEPVMPVMWDPLVGEFVGCWRRDPPSLDTSRGRVGQSAAERKYRGGLVQFVNPHSSDRSTAGSHHRVRLPVGAMDEQTVTSFASVDVESAGPSSFTATHAAEWTPGQPRDSPNGDDTGSAGRTEGGGGGSGNSSTTSTPVRPPACVIPSKYAHLTTHGHTMAIIDRKSGAVLVGDMASATVQASAASTAPILQLHTAIFEPDSEDVCFSRVSLIPDPTVRSAKDVDAPPLDPIEALKQQSEGGGLCLVLHQIPTNALSRPASPLPPCSIPRTPPSLSDVKVGSWDAWHNVMHHKRRPFMWPLLQLQTNLTSPAAVAAMQDRFAAMDHMEAVATLGVLVRSPPGLGVTAQGIVSFLNQLGSQNRPTPLTLAVQPADTFACMTSVSGIDASAEWTMVPPNAQADPVMSVTVPRHIRAQIRYVDSTPLRAVQPCPARQRLSWDSVWLGAAADLIYALHPSTDQDSATAITASHCAAARHHQTHEQQRGSTAHDESRGGTATNPMSEELDALTVFEDWVTVAKAMWLEYERKLRSMTGVSAKGNSHAEIRSSASRRGRQQTPPYKPSRLPTHPSMGEEGLSRATEARGSSEGAKRRNSWTDEARRPRTASNTNNSTADTAESGAEMIPAMVHDLSKSAPQLPDSATVASASAKSPPPHTSHSFTTPANTRPSIKREPSSRGRTRSGGVVMGDAGIPTPLRPIVWMSLLLRRRRAQHASHRRSHGTSQAGNIRAFPTLDEFRQLRDAVLTDAGEMGGSEPTAGAVAAAATTSDPAQQGILTPGSPTPHGRSRSATSLADITVDGTTLQSPARVGPSPFRGGLSQAERSLNTTGHSSRFQTPLRKQHSATQSSSDDLQKLLHGAQLPMTQPQAPVSLSSPESVASGAAKSPYIGAVGSGSVEDTTSPEAGLQARLRALNLDADDDGSITRVDDIDEEDGDESGQLATETMSKLSDVIPNKKLLRQTSVRLERTLRVLSARRLVPASQQLDRNGAGDLDGGDATGGARVADDDVPRSRGRATLDSLGRILDEVDKDLPRTFGFTGLFRPGAAFTTQLRNGLAAYCHWDLRTGYVQGMSYVGAVLCAVVAQDDFVTCLITGRHGGAEAVAEPSAAVDGRLSQGAAEDPSLAEEWVQLCDRIRHIREDQQRRQDMVQSSKTTQGDAVEGTASQAAASSVTTPIPRVSSSQSVPSTASASAEPNTEGQLTPGLSASNSSSTLAALASQTAAAPPRTPPRSVRRGADPSATPGTPASPSPRQQARWETATAMAAQTRRLVTSLLCESAAEHAMHAASTMALEAQAENAVARPEGTTPPSASTSGGMHATPMPPAVLATDERTYTLFLCLTSLLHDPVLLPLLRVEPLEVLVRCTLFDVAMQRYMPELYTKLEGVGANSNVYLFGWLQTLLVKVLPVDLVVYVWDGILLFGSEYLVRACLGVLKVLEHAILEASEEAILGTLTASSAQWTDIASYGGTSSTAANGAANPKSGAGAGGRSAPIASSAGKRKLWTMIDQIDPQQLLVAIASVQLDDDLREVVRAMEAGEPVALDQLMAKPGSDETEEGGEGEHGQGNDTDRTPHRSVDEARLLRDALDSMF